MIVSLLLVAISCQSARSQKTHALLVGVGNYLSPANCPDPKLVAIPDGVRSLRCPENDVAMFKSLLLEKYAASKCEPLVLLHEQATRNAVVEALQAFAGRCNANDTFIFYYSGHGAQIKNPRSPEADRLDEVLLPYDAVLKGKLIRDKEIRDLLAAITGKGTEVIALFDCCHSGSMSRDVNYETKSIPTIEAELEEYSSNAIRGNDDKLVVLSAARSDELATARGDANGRMNSMFTQSLVAAFRQGKENETLDGLLRECQSYLDAMKVTQHPVLDATAERRKRSLSGKQVSDSIGLSIQRVLSGNRAIVSGSDALVLSIGAVLCDDSGTTRAEVVRMVSLTEAELQFPKNVKKLPAIGAPMRIQSLSADAPALKLFFSHHVGDSRAAEFASAIDYFEEHLRRFVESTKGSIVIVDSANADYLLHLVHATRSSSWMLERIHGQDSGLDAYPAEPRSTLCDAIAPERAYRYMESTLSGISRYLSLLHLRGCAAYCGELAVSCNGQPIDASEAVLKLNDYIEYSIRWKEGASAAGRKYVYVVGLSQNGSSSLLYPMNGTNAENYLPSDSHKPGEVLALGHYNVFPPAGVDHLMLLALDTPLSNPHLLEQPEPGTRSVADGNSMELPLDEKSTKSDDGCTFHCSSVRLISKE